jgi:tetratricopeptide (TPR) repeat protein
MGRFFNREAAVVALSLLVAGVAVGLLSELRPWLVAVVSVALVAILHWPLTITFQRWVLGYYTDHGKLQRALELAVEVRDSAMTRAERDQSTLDVAFIHMARGDYEKALDNLRKPILSNQKPMTRAVVEASTGYCLAWLGRDLDRADELVQSAIAASQKAQLEEPLFGYFLGLLRLKQGRLADARGLVERSLAAEPDPKLPHPGERPFVMAQILKGLGDAAQAKAELEKSRAAGGRFGDLAARELSGQAA